MASIPMNLSVSRREIYSKELSSEIQAVLFSRKKNRTPQERPRKKLKGLAAEIFKPWVSVPGLWVSCLSYLCLIILFGRSWLIILEKEMATHSSTSAWKIPWAEEPSRL